MIQVEHLTKYYGDVRAVDDLTFVGEAKGLRGGHLRAAIGGGWNRFTAELPVKGGAQGSS